MKAVDKILPKGDYMKKKEVRWNEEKGEKEKYEREIKESKGRLESEKKKTKNQERL